MEIRQLNIPEVLEIIPNIHDDDRGWFHRVYSERELRRVINKPIKQINHSYNNSKGTFRGFHYQNGLHVESKLIRSVSGRVYDMALDIRKGSPTFLQIAAVELDVVKRNMIYIPEGFAHGFITLEDKSQLEYYHSQEYEKESEGGINIYDPKLKITLPLDIQLISERDKSFDFLKETFIGI